MPTFDDYRIGQRFDAPARTVTEPLVELLTTLGGYTHPLFTDATFVEERTPFAFRPLPGQGVLLLLGGLAEQSPAFDEHAVALVGLDEVRFRSPALVGDTLRLEQEVVALDARGERGLVTLRWRCIAQDDRLVLGALARMLVGRG